MYNLARDFNYSKVQKAASTRHKNELTRTKKKQTKNDFTADLAPSSYF